MSKFTDPRCMMFGTDSDVFYEDPDGNGFQIRTMRYLLEKWDATNWGTINDAVKNIRQYGYAAIVLTRCWDDDEKQAEVLLVAARERGT